MSARKRSDPHVRFALRFWTVVTAAAGTALMAIVTVVPDAWPAVVIVALCAIGLWTIAVALQRRGS